MRKFSVYFIVSVLLVGVSISSAQSRLRVPKKLDEFKSEAIEKGITGTVSVQVFNATVRDSILRDLRLLHPVPNDRASIAFRGKLDSYHDYLIRVGIEIWGMTVGETKLQLVCLENTDSLNVFKYYAVGGMELFLIKIPAKAFLEASVSGDGLVSLEYWVEDTADKMEKVQEAIRATPGLSDYSVKDLVSNEFKRALELLKCRVYKISKGNECSKD